jgi:hypothetical protein
MEFNGLFGRPFDTGTDDDVKVYDRQPTISPHPGWYDDADARKGERLNARQMPVREKATLRVSNRIFNSLGMNGSEGDLFAVEDVRSSISITPLVAAGTQVANITVDRDVILDGGLFPSNEPGAALYLGVRNFSVTAVATTATGAIAWAAQLGNGPLISLGTTPASPSAALHAVRGYVPFPLPPDRLPQGAVIGILYAFSDTVAAPVAVRATLGFSILYSIPEGR